MEYKDYYKVMGVGRDATQDDIKRAFRKLARKYHPDVSKEADAELKFKDLNEANEVLKDPEKRAAYDQLGSNWNAQQGFKPPPDWGTGFEFHGAPRGETGRGEFSDFFESLFGQMGGGGGARGFHMQGEDHHAKILIDLQDSYHGASRSISLQVPEVTPDGHVVTRNRTLKVAIPKGIRQGQQIRLTGQGAKGQGSGRAGDLYLEVEFRPHRLYRVDGADVHLELPVTPWEAALGAKVNVPTPSGTIDLTIPPNSQAGKKLRLKGRGLPSRPAGDLYVVLQLVLPSADDANARKIYQRMKEEVEFNPRATMEVA
ncbi:MAG: DnaJ domain-containing protein [Xanthomonadales bacterium]|nr:DnaJ domain-containing protein [Gammaproteobacteria bacterium]NNK04555.1 DnaJ domain-containing protein [Xanthomonadales bacterium]NNK99266.1 DnaJ domain-containing protein [Xanthomonadales bacterium]